VESIAVGAELPNVVGLGFDEAVRSLGKLNFHGVLANGSPESGVVVSQSPEAGGLSGARTRVTLVLAGDPVEVPTLSDKSAAEAAAAVDQVGLRLSPAGGENDFVSSQDPLPGEILQRGEVVSVEYRTLVLVPNIVDSDVDKARATLEAVKLSMIIEGATQLGTIKSQDPEAGTRVDPDTVITVTVQPPVVLSPSSAVETPTSKVEPIPSNSTPVTPQQTDPVSTTTPAETTVQTTISSTSSAAPSGPAKTNTEQRLVKVPPLFGLRRSDAEALVATAGLQAEASGDLDGVIVEQIPAAGTEVPLGSIVTVGFETESNWWLPPLLILIVVAGFAGAAYLLHQQRQRRPQWLSQHVSFRPDARRGSADVATFSRSAANDMARTASRHGLPGSDNPTAEELSDHDHIIALVGHRSRNSLLLEERQ
jgi:beta-lactam-binding protein with PASTA domain